MPIHRTETNMSWNNDYGEKRKKWWRRETRFAIIQHETRCRCDIKLRTEIPEKVKGRQWIICNSMFTLSL